MHKLNHQHRHLRAGSRWRQAPNLQFLINYLGLRPGTICFWPACSVNFACCCVLVGGRCLCCSLELRVTIPWYPGIAIPLLFPPPRFPYRYGIPVFSTGIFLFLLSTLYYCMAIPVKFYIKWWIIPINRYSTVL